MKFIGLLLFLLIGCQEKFGFSTPEVVVNSASISGGRIILSGNYLNTVVSASPTSTNLSGYKMEIESKTSSSITVRLTHASNNALSLAMGTVLTFIVSTAHAQTTVNLTIEAAVPSGAIVAYDGACPSGWSEFVTGKGRVLVGAGVGNNDSLGAALTNRVIASVGGLEYTTGLPATLGNADEQAPDPTFALALSGGSIYTGGSPINTTLSGDKADSNMPPYVVVRYCQKD